MTKLSGNETMGSLGNKILLLINKNNPSALRSKFRLYQQQDLVITTRFWSITEEIGEIRHHDRDKRLEGSFNLRGFDAYLVDEKFDEYKKRLMEYV